ncbi:MAG: family 16 glycosylhydrolase [Flavobacteriales bacterium]
MTILQYTLMRRCCLLFVFLFGIASYSLAQCSQLVWADEFNGSSLDLSKWSYQIGNGTNDGLDVGWGNQESEYYTSRPENVSVTGGNLVITARAESYLGANYTSGRIRSLGKGDWQYGSFEARIKVPEPFNDSKAWPGFWMLPQNNNWPYTGEIDIMETGNQYNEWKYNGTLHYYANAHQTSGTGGVTINTTTMPNGDLSKDFHIYRVDWAPNSIKFFVDNIQIGATLSNANTIAGAWPFDASGKFYIILNMAINGWFPGMATPNNSRFPLSMLVDYVRVYSTPSAVQITGDAKVLQGEKGVVYTVPFVAGNSYNWNLPSGATIVSGTNTNQITVDYGAAAIGGNVSVTITPSGGGCTASTSSLPVSVVAKTCTMVLEDFEGPGTRNLGFNFSTGWMNRVNTTTNPFPTGTFNNPSKTSPNTSTLVGKYERNGGSQYDVLAYNDIVIGNADSYKNGTAGFTMLVRSDAPAGTEVMIQLENRLQTPKGWPNGIHSRYTAVTGTPNTWTKLTFKLKDTPDMVLKGDSVNQIVLLFKPNSYTSNTYYFDDFKSEGNTPATGNITGTSTNCANSTGIVFSTTGFAASTFNWTVPAGATITAGQGSKKITMTSGATGGTISVIETSVLNCVGSPKSIVETIGSAGCSVGVQTLNPSDLLVYPNPAGDHLMIHLNSYNGEESTITLVNAMSQQLLSYSQSLSSGENNITLPLTNIENGVYFLSIQRGEEYSVKTVVVMK